MRLQELIVALACVAAFALPARAEVLNTPARLSPLATKAMLVSIAPAGKRIVAAGERGIVLFSDDGGARWTQAAVPVSVNLTALHFADARHGWAAGHDGVVLATTDGGARWTKQLDGNAINAMLLADAKARLARAESAAGAAPGAKPAQDALDAAKNALFEAEDGMKFGPSRPFLGIWFKDVREGYAVGAFGLALRTMDGGAHWTSIGPDMGNADGLHLNAVGPAPAGGLLVAGEGGRIYRSADGGSHWSRQDTGYNGQLYGAFGLGGARLLAYGFGGKLLRSDDDGKHWQELPSPTRKSVVGAGRAPDGSVLAVARDGALLRSSDDGASFVQVLPPRGLQLAAVLMAAKPLAVGMGGVHAIDAINAINKQGVPAQ
jgi:photosystem II stability/assembly factor-like uncharacterized protein